jgi:uncharacterized protein (TIGR02118 family)
MAAKALVLYNEPADPAAFEAYYFGTHVPLAKKMPGVKKYTVNRGPLAAAAGQPPYFFMAELEFDSMDALQASFGSPEGAAAAGDLPNFATGGVTVLMYEIQEL